MRLRHIFEPGKAMLLFLIGIGCFPLENATCQNREEDFDWLESLALPNPENLRFVRIHQANHLEGDRYYYGFVSPRLPLPLTLETPDQERVEPPGPPWGEEIFLTMDLQEIPLAKVSTGNQFGRLPATQTLEEADLATYTSIFLKRDFDVIRSHRRRIPGAVEDSMFPSLSHLFLLSWFLEQKGYLPLSQTVYDQVTASPVPAHSLFNSFRGRTPSNYREALSMEFDQTLYLQALERFVGLYPHRMMEFDPSKQLLQFNPHLARIRLLADFESLLKHFPEAADREFAEHAIPILRKMIEEDRQHVFLTLEETQGLPLPFAMKELLFRLRDSLTVSRFVDGRSSPIYAALVEKGAQSVPYLIEALDNDRPVRCLENYPMSAPKDGPPRLYRVGDVSAALLREITGENFFLPADSFSSWKEGLAFRKELKEEAKEWWALRQEAGEEKYLVGVVSKGEEAGASMLRRLHSRYPDRYLEATIAGLKATPKSIAPREKYLDFLRREEGKEIDALYRTELETGPSFSCRLTAAKALFRRGFPEEAVSAMIAEWNNRKEMIKNDPNRWFPPFPYLIEFLLTCDNPAAIETIAADYETLPPIERHQIVSRLRMYQNVLGEQAPPEYSKEFREAVYKFLLEACHDDTMQRSYASSTSQKEDRIGDVAGEALRKWWPDRISVRDPSQLRKGEHKRKTE